MLDLALERMVSQRLSSNVVPQLLISSERLQGLAATPSLAGLWRWHLQQDLIAVLRPPVAHPPQLPSLPQESHDISTKFPSTQAAPGWQGKPKLLG